MPDKRSMTDGPARALLLSGTSEIGLEILAGLAPAPLVITPAAVAPPRLPGSAGALAPRQAA
jgi:hypothetical protein